MNWEDLKWITHWVLVVPIMYLWIEVQSLKNKMGMTKAIEAAAEERFKQLESNMKEVKEGVQYLVRREIEKLDK